MAINKQQIRSVLTHVIHPSLGKDLITLDMIRDLIVQEKYITFTVELAEESPTIETKIKELCEDTIRHYVDKEAVLDIQTKVNTFRQKEIENREVQEMEKGNNPMNMSEPTADNYASPTTINPVPYEEMPDLLRQFMDEHEKYLEEIDTFEQALLRFKKEQWVMDKEMNRVFSHFFQFLDADVLDHNQREEEQLFPLLKKRLLESGEHSQPREYMSNEEPQTAVELLEDDHIKLIQLSTLTFNFLGLAQKLPDVHSQAMVSDLAFEQGQQLIETLRLHIQREDKTLFPLACHLISDQEFGELGSTMKETIH